MKMCLNFIKKNLVFCIVLVVFICCAFISYLEYEHFYQTNWVDMYYLKLELCENNPAKQNLCENLEYPERENVFEVFDGMQSVGIGGNGITGKIQWVAFILVVAAGIWNFQKNFSHGILKNKLTRYKYSKILKKEFFSAYKAAFLLPIYMILLWIASCCYASDFSANLEFMALSPVAHLFNDFSVFYITYFGIQLLIYFLISIYYINIALIIVKKSKNFIFSIIKSYVIFIILDIFFSFFLCEIILPYLFRVKLDSLYFNTLGGYWGMVDMHWGYLLLIVSCLVVLSYIAVKFVYRNKEQVVVESEK